MIHTDRAADFLAEETKRFLLKKVLQLLKQVVTIRKETDKLRNLMALYGRQFKYLHFRNMKLSCWEDFLPHALHSIRSLLCTATNVTCA